MKSNSLYIPIIVNCKKNKTVKTLALIEVFPLTHQIWADLIRIHSEFFWPEMAVLEPTFLIKFWLDPSLTKFWADSEQSSCLSPWYSIWTPYGVHWTQAHIWSLTAQMDDEEKERFYDEAEKEGF